MMALVAASANIAVAQDALKEIAKAATYQEAEQLLNSNLGSLTDAQKAKGYWSVLEKAMKVYNKEATIVATNQANLALKADAKQEPYDTVAMYTALDKAFDLGKECYKYDQLPNDKGKVSPKYEDKLGEQLWNNRVGLIQAGQWCGDKRDNEGVAKYFGKYVDTASDPMFAKLATQPDPNLNVIAANAARFAYFSKDYDKAIRYAEIVENDPEFAKEASQVKVSSFRDQLKTHEDSVNLSSKLQTMFENNPSNDAVFTTLQGIYYGLGQNDKANALVDQRLAANPEDVLALELQGQSFYDNGKYDEAIANFTKAAQKDEKNAALNLLIGACYINKGQQLSESLADARGNITQTNQQKVNEFYKQGIPFLEKARELDPENNSKWAYYLYRSYYLVKGENDPATKEVEAIMNKR